MPLTLEEYAEYLDTRKDIPWPAAPEVKPAKARPHLESMPNIKAVLWNVYGTLLAMPLGELVFEHPQPLVMEIALDKTINEFKMWASMSRKPGQPAEYMKTLYAQELLLQRGLGAGERIPEVLSERIWEAIIKKLFQKEYTFDAGFYGALTEYSKKVAYFFHASLQATAAEPEAALALKLTADAGKVQGLLADGQCFTTVQLTRGLRQQESDLNLAKLLPLTLRTLSCAVKARKPSETIFRHALAALAEKGIRPGDVLHVGTKLSRDIAPARKLGMRTALYAGDKASLEVTPEQLKDPNQRPDVLLTELGQIAQVVM
ncbi:MAG TPA: HAD family hydrolase [Gemmataceae bacterium]|jgi:FMN phosphatase YigB (HAD superfamily)|nr:HAD family hydrolase [Gemmataceae bacterium]